jgi:hypothetical protein
MTFDLDPTREWHDNQYLRIVMKFHEFMALQRRLLPWSVKA